MSSTFQDRVAIVTGVAGETGIGFAIARQLAEAEARLVIVDISEKVYARKDELTHINKDIIACQADLTCWSEVKCMAETVLKTYGRIDILVNNAGMAVLGEHVPSLKVMDMPEEHWDYGISINLKTVFNCCKAVLPVMLEQKYGRIVCNASATGPVVSNPGSAPYAAAKAGIVGLVRTLAIETGQSGITVNAVAPGWIATGASTPDELAAGRNTPVGRSGSPEEVAAAVLFLADDKSSYITGQMLVVDGGNGLPEYRGVTER